MTRNENIEEASNYFRMKYFENDYMNLGHECGYWVVGVNGRKYEIKDFERNENLTFIEELEYKFIKKYPELFL